MGPPRSAWPLWPLEVPVYRLPSSFQVPTHSILFISGDSTYHSATSNTVNQVISPVASAGLSTWTSLSTSYSPFGLSLANTGSSANLWLAVSESPSGSIGVFQFFTTYQPYASVTVGRGPNHVLIQNLTGPNTSHMIVTNQKQ